MNASLGVRMLLVLIVLGVAVWGLRAFTMATYRGTPADSRTAIEFDVVTRGTPSSPATAARGLLWPCVADVDSELVGEITTVSDDRFAALLQPALDATETRKFRGCLRDLRVAHVRATAVALERMR